MNAASRLNRRARTERARLPDPIAAGDTCHPSQKALFRPNSCAKIAGCLSQSKELGMSQVSYGDRLAARTRVGAT